MTTASAGSTELTAAGATVSDLVRLCLSQADRDEEQPLAWTNAICFAFLIVGLIGLTAPEPKLQPSRSPSVDIVPVVFEPPVPTQFQASIGAPQESTDTPEISLPEQPPLLRVVPVEVPVGFEIPIAAPAILVPLPKYTSPPPREVPDPVAPTPAAPPRVERFQPRRDGGSYPAITYPPSAEAARQQGRVLLYFVVDPSGAVTSVEVRESSGYGILDRHAAQWIKRKYQFPPGETRYYEREFIFQLK